MSLHIGAASQTGVDSRKQEGGSAPELITEGIPESILCSLTL